MHGAEQSIKQLTRVTSLQRNPIRVPLFMALLDILQYFSYTDSDEFQCLAIVYNTSIRVIFRSVNDPVPREQPIPASYIRLIRGN